MLKEMGSLGKFPKLLCLSLLIDEWGVQYFPASECCYKDEVGENKPSPQHSAWGHSKQTLNAAWCVLMTENSLLPFSTCPLILGVPQSLTCSHFSVRYFILFYIILYFWPGRPACGILVPRPGIEPGPSAVKVQSLNHWTTREFPSVHYFKISLG